MCRSKLENMIVVQAGGVQTHIATETLAESYLPVPCQ